MMQILILEMKNMRQPGIQMYYAVDAKTDWLMIRANRP
jgi:hypothetical protein